MKTNLLIGASLLLAIPASFGLTTAPTHLVSPRGQQFMSAETPLASPLQAPTRATDDEVIVGPYVDYEYKLITEAPSDGVTKQYVNEANGYYRTSFGVTYTPITSMAELTFCDNGDVYWKNPISHYATDSYIVGKMEEGQIRFTLPQLLYDGPNQAGVPTQLYATMMEYIFIGDEDSEDGGYAIPDDRNELVLIMEDDAIYFNTEIELQGTYFAETIFGLTYGVTPVWDTFLWTGYGDGRALMLPYKPKISTFPEGVTPDAWQIKGGFPPQQEAGWTPAPGDNPEPGYALRNLTGYIDGNTLYLGNLNTEDPSICVKGTIDGNTVTFKGAQELGFMYDYNSFAYLIFGYYAVRTDGYVTYIDTTIPEVTFTFNPDTKTLQGSEGVTLFVNAMTNEIWYMQNYDLPEIRYVSPEELCAAPVNPVMIDCLADYSQVQSTYVYCGIQAANINAVAIEPERLYYRLIIDDKPYEMTPYEYPSLEKSYEWIPYFYTDMSRIIMSGEGRLIHYDIADVMSVGMQVRYDAPDGQIYLSKVVAYYPEEEKLKRFDYDDLGGVETLSDNAAMEMSTEWYDLSGRRVVRPQSGGIYLKSSVMSDGSRRTVKEVVR